MGPNTVWSNFGEDEVPDEVPILDETMPEPIDVEAMVIELGLDLTDMYRDQHDY